MKPLTSGRSQRSWAEKVKDDVIQKTLTSLMKETGGTGESHENSQYFNIDSFSTNTKKSA